MECPIVYALPAGGSSCGPVRNRPRILEPNTPCLTCIRRTLQRCKAPAHFFVLSISFNATGLGFVLAGLATIGNEIQEFLNDPRGGIAIP